MKQELILDMEPRGKGRHRTTKSGHVYTPAGTRAAQKAIQFEARRQGIRLQRGPLRVDVYSWFPIPASWPKWKKKAALRREIWPTKKPDRDNLDKLILDSLNGIAWRDDTQVVDGRIVKQYGARGVILVEIQPIPGRGHDAKRAS